MREGKLIALASAGTTRTPIAPDLPTLAEAGVTDFEAGLWFALMAPAGTAQDITRKLSQAVNDALRDDATKASLYALGIETRGGTPEELSVHVAAELTRWGEVARGAGLAMKAD